MISNYVCCEDCEYKDYCHNFDAFWGCEDGKHVDQKTDNFETFNEELVEKQC